MKFYAHLILAIAAPFLIAACSSDDTTATTAGGDNTSGSAISVNSVSGNDYFLDGTWRACYTVNSLDFGETRVVLGTSITGNSYNYTSTDNTCSTGESEDTTQALVFTASNPADLTTVGWSNQSALVSAPAAQDGTTVIANPAVATLFDITGTSGGVSVTGRFVAYIDDTVTGNIIWYRSVGSPAACDPDSSGSEQCLLTVDNFVKQ